MKSTVKQEGENVINEIFIVNKLSYIIDYYGSQEVAAVSLGITRSTLARYLKKPNKVKIEFLFKILKEASAIDEAYAQEYGVVKNV